jgi:iron complex outermembrane receptor protein
MRTLTLIFTFVLNLYAQSDLFELSLEDLSSIEIQNTSASLTKTNQKNTPASITIITHKDIVESGARDLDELLEIYVPSFSYLYKVQGTQIGFRGIISDRNNKVLLLVNGRVMNIKTTDGGAATERLFSTLDDIDTIKVITGSGSAIYGSGAIAGVISIDTFSGKTRNGVYLSSKVGAGEEFYNAEISYGTNIKDDLYMYIYYGLEKDDGAKNSDAPLKFAFDYSGEHAWNQNIYAPADEPYKYNTINDGAALDNELKHKLYFQLDNDIFTFWARFTKSSMAIPTAQPMYQYMTDSNGAKFSNTGTKNQQITLFSQIKQDVSQDLHIKYQLSYLRSDIANEFFDGNDENNADKHWGEDNIMSKVLLNYTIDKQNQLALGAEYNYNNLGKKSMLYSSDKSKLGILPPATSWHTDLLSFFGEYQMQFRDDFTVFFGARADKHTYSDFIYSPRLDFVYNLNDKDVFKLGFNRSIRYSDEVDMYKIQLQNQSGDTEEIDTIEFNYTKYLKDITFQITTFYNEQDIVAWDNLQSMSTNIGKVESYGFEAQLHYNIKKLEFDISHSYTQLINFNLNNTQLSFQNISAAPYGYGDDFANWNNHISKLRLNYKFNSNLKWINSLRILWGMDGAQDVADYNKDLNLPLSKKYILSYYDEGHTRAFGESIYLNSSLIWNYNKTTSFTLNAYNILGLLDEDYNKRNFFNQESQYRDSVPSIAIGLKYRF